MKPLDEDNMELRTCNIVRMMNTAGGMGRLKEDYEPVMALNCVIPERQNEEEISNGLFFGAQLNFNRLFILT